MRVAVSACGVNFVDALFVAGTYQIRPPVPFVPGSEVAGRVTEVGEHVDSVAVGQRVFANVGLGGYASEAVVSARQVVAVPDALTDGQAATFAQSYLTAWFALHARAQVARGDTIAVLGAGSGVGLAAVDVASAAGLAVVAIASTPDKRALAERHGAVAAIDGSLPPAEVKDAIRAFAADHGAPPGGVHHLYDPVGGELGETCLRAVGEHGQHLVIGFVAGIPRLPANQVLLRNRCVVGVDWGAWSGRHPDENRAMLGAVLAAISAGDLHPAEPITFPLDDAATALTELGRRTVAGKVALVP